MIASSPVRMQDQNASTCMLQVSAVQVHQQYVVPPSLQQAGLSTTESARSNAVLGATGLSSWSSPADTALVEPYSGGTAAGSASSSLLDDDLTPTAAFQQLLDSFGGCQTTPSDVDDDDVDDDDTVVVSLDHPNSLQSLQARHAIRSLRHHHHQQQQQRLHPIVQPQQHAVCSAARC